MYAQVCKSFGEGDGWVRPYLYEPCSSKCSTENLDFWVITLPKKTRRHTYFAAIDWKVRPFGLRDNVCQSRTAFMPLLCAEPFIGSNATRNTIIASTPPQKSAYCPRNAAESIFQKPCSFRGQNEEEWAKRAHTYAYGMQIDHGQLVNGNENTKRVGRKIGKNSLRMANQRALQQVN